MLAGRRVSRPVTKNVQSCSQWQTLSSDSQQPAVTSPSASCWCWASLYWRMRSGLLSDGRHRGSRWMRTWWCTVSWVIDSLVVVKFCSIKQWRTAEESVCVCLRLPCSVVCGALAGAAACCLPVACVAQSRHSMSAWAILRSAPVQHMCIYLCSAPYCTIKHYITACSRVYSLRTRQLSADALILCKKRLLIPIFFSKEEAEKS